jgi:hypothetical protein
LIQPVLLLYECADPIAAESTAAKSTTESLYSSANSASIESVAEPLRSVADSAADGAAPTETS